MIRTIVGCFLICISIIWLPVWVQIVFFIAGVMTLRYRFVLLVPAMLADALYAPATVSLWAMKYTIGVLVLLGVWWVLLSYTRLKDFYDVEKK